MNTFKHLLAIYLTSLKIKKSWVIGNTISLIGVFTIAITTITHGQLMVGVWLLVISLYYLTVFFDYLSSLGKVSPITWTIYTGVMLIASVSELEPSEGTPEAYQLGFKEGIDEALKIITEMEPEKVVSYAPTARVVIESMEALLKEKEES